MHADQTKSSSRQTLVISSAAWAIGSILVAAYHWAAGVASHAYELPLTLEPHRSAQVRVVSLFGHAIETELIFQREGSDRMTQTAAFESVSDARTNYLSSWRAKSQLESICNEIGWNRERVRLSAVRLSFQWVTRFGRGRCPFHLGHDDLPPSVGPKGF